VKAIYFSFHAGPYIFFDPVPVLRIDYPIHSERVDHFVLLISENFGKLGVNIGELPVLKNMGWN